MGVNQHWSDVQEEPNNCIEISENKANVSSKNYLFKLPQQMI